MKMADEDGRGVSPAMTKFQVEAAKDELRRVFRKPARG